MKRGATVALIANRATAARSTPPMTEQRRDTMRNRARRFLTSYANASDASAGAEAPNEPADMLAAASVMTITRSIDRSVRLFLS